MRKLVFSLICFLFSLGAIADEYQIWGFTFDKVTNFPVDNVCVILMKDEVPVDTAYTSMRMVNGKERPFFQFYVKEKGIYTLRLIHPKFVTQEVTADISKLKNHGLEVLDFIYLSRIPKDKQLSGTTVHATRIKMLYRGDTIVYDADAFQLAKGSMLEALIEELPGAQLKDDGQIFVNGRKVDELLLNGKDFFHNNQLVLLENLPAYMVKNIKVYEKDDPYRTTTKKPLAMNVVLKKQYQRGWIANAEAAYGTDNRYLGRLFGFRYTDNSGISAYFNANNVNDNRRPGGRGNSEWQQQDAAYSGRVKTIKGGIDYSLYDPYEVYKFSSSDEVVSTRQHLSQQQTGATYLPQGNTYRMNLYDMHDNKTLWTSKNTLNLQLGKKKNKLDTPNANLIEFNLSYSSDRRRSSFAQIEHNLSPDSIDLGFRDLRGDIEESRWYNLLLNSNGNNTSAHTYKFDTKFRISSITEVGSNGKIYVNAEYNYSHQNTTNYTNRYIDYPSDLSKASDSYRRYTHTPLTNYSVYGRLAYSSYVLPYLCIFPSVEYTRTYNSSDRSLFNLSALEGWGIDSDRALRSLPSTRDSLQMCKDAVNSYYSRTYEDKVTINLGPQADNMITKDFQLQYDLRIPFDIIHTRLHYQRNTLDATERRTKVLFNPGGYFRVRLKNKVSYGFNFGKNTTLPSLVYRLNITDTSDPLNTTLGNAHLKNPTSYYFGLSFRRYNMPHYASVSTELNYTLVRHALAQGFLYDTATGIRTTRPDNVNGNWNINGKTDFSRSFLKNDVLAFESHTSYGYLHSVDLTGTTQIERSIVHNVYTNEELSMKYKFGKNNIGFKGKLNWTNLSSRRDNFQTQNLWDFNYGLTALLNLPWQLQLSTDITVFSHRGYDEHSMNRNDIVWNARLTRVFFNGKVTCFIDGFDILGQLSNIQRYVNAQGRTETRYNVQPRYAMIHFIYRFAKQPKKRQ